MQKETMARIAHVHMPSLFESIKEIKKLLNTHIESYNVEEVKKLLDNHREPYQEEEEKELLEKITLIYRLLSTDLSLYESRLVIIQQIIKQKIES